MKSKGLKRLHNRITKDIVKMENKRTEIYKNSNKEGLININTLNDTIDYQKSTLRIIEEVDKESD